MRINLTDNGASQPLHRDVVADLFPIADKTIAELCQENENLLIFPHSIESSIDKIGDSSIMALQSTDNKDEVCVGTGNVMGFIGVGNLQVKIKSRFDVGRDDYLLHYMLQKVLSFNLFDLSHNNEQEDVFDFIMFMFPYFLKAALRQGVYREYQNYKHNDANLKGTIDVGRHIAKNVPFVGNIAYSTREYSHDNNMTELIRHTIEFMRTKKYGQSVLNIDRETVENVKTIIEHTPLYSKSERGSIISKNLRMKTHLYYTEYRPLQALCLQILRMEEMKYGESDDEICGILFDGAWLWEEYVNTILSDLGFTHPENRLGKGRIYIFDDRSGVIYPDFYNNKMVLDAKYKRLGGYDKVAQVGNADIYQVMAYMTRLDVEKGGFIAPLESPQDKVPTSRLKGKSVTLSIYGIEISKMASSYADFCAQMKTMEATFIESLKL
ncbi:MAG: hypothetical protein IJV05_07575 [Muribaculaceae bacterium]|nr:hypothetical protein [Muribaculaceae bacterium]